MRRLTRSLRTSGRLAGLAVADIAWRFPTLTPGDGAGVDIAIAVISIAIDISDIPLIEELSTALLLGYAAAVFRQWLTLTNSVSQHPKLNFDSCSVA